VYFKLVGMLILFVSLNSGQMYCLFLNF